MNRISRLLLTAVILFGLPGCSSIVSDEKFVSELTNLDKVEIFDRGEKLYQEEEYTESRRYFSFVYDTFPNDPLGHKAALRIADTYAKQGDSMNMTEARLRYKDFTNRYPNDPDRDYALLMLGFTYVPRKLQGDRDLEPVRQARSTYQQLITLYPDSQYIGQAKEKLDEINSTLANHEWLVAQFYARNKRWHGTRARLEYLKDNFPEYESMDQVEALLVQANENIEAREREIERIKQEMAAKISENEESAKD